MALRSSETSATTCPATGVYTPEDLSLQQHHRECPPGRTVGLRVEILTALCFQCSLPYAQKIPRVYYKDTRLIAGYYESHEHRKYDTQSFRKLKANGTYNYRFV